MIKQNLICRDFICYCFLFNWLGWRFRNNWQFRLGYGSWNSLLNGSYLNWSNWCLDYDWSDWCLNDHWSNWRFNNDWFGYLLRSNVDDTNFAGELVESEIDLNAGIVWNIVEAVEGLITLHLGEPGVGWNAVEESASDESVDVLDLVEACYLLVGGGEVINELRVVEGKFAIDTLADGELVPELSLSDHHDDNDDVLSLAYSCQFFDISSFW